MLGVCSGLAGGLLESAGRADALTRVLYGTYRVCWAPVFLMRDLQLAMASHGVAAQGELPGLLGLLLLPVLWFFAFLAGSRWLYRR